MATTKLSGKEAVDLAKDLLRTYFKTQGYPLTRHHIDSFDQFLKEDLIRIVQSQNPILLLKDLIPQTNKYRYKVEIFMGGKDGTGFYIGSPSINRFESTEVRLLFPNEARLRNLTYAATVYADLYLKITRVQTNEAGKLVEVVYEESWTKTAEKDERLPLFQIPIMLHSRYCVLHNKPAAFLREVGECEYDYGGYFIVNGAEKVLVTHQEQAFNTLYTDYLENDPMLALYANIKCLSPKTRMVHQMSFTILKNAESIQISLPMIRKPVPLFVLFRAMGVQSDYDILRLIFPDEDSAECKLLQDKLMPSIQDAVPFLDQYTALQYMKTMTKGFSEAHVLDVLYNKTFTHIENRPGARVAFLGDCIRKLLRVYAKIDPPTDRDDIRNQRCLPSGFLTQMLFQGVYKTYCKVVARTIEEEYKYNDKIYSGDNFKNIFLEGNRSRMFKLGSGGDGFLTEGIMKAFKGKWSGAVGEDKQGVLQSLSRLSYHDFISHCRRMVLEFDTSLKIKGPRTLHPSQYGYFCTNETPTGGSIGITKNLSILTAISTSTNPTSIIKWLFERGGVIQCDQTPYDVLRLSVAFYLNGGLLGYTLNPTKLVAVLKLFKRTGCLPSTAGIGFSIPERRVFLYLDEGRPMRPLIAITQPNVFPSEALSRLKKWRDLVMGTLPETSERDLAESGFFDPFTKREDIPQLDEYIEYLSKFTGVIEYIDPYEHNLCFIANYPEYMTLETSHVEIHPSTILGLMTNMIPFANHNQSPRNQLSCSQSKQGLSIYSTRYKTRFDNQVHVLCYGEAPLCRTLYYDYVGDGNIGYGHNLILAIGSFTGYNQDDGIVMNKDSFDRGMFRNMSFRSYTGFEENDTKAKTRTRIANPAKIPAWTDLAKGVDYTKLDDRGIIRKGEYVDQNTVIIGRYIQVEGGPMRDASVTPQVWTSGRVDDVIILVNNQNLRIVKIKVVQDRIPELGDKFSNRHGQKGTIGMLIPGVDMPRTRDGLIPDMIMNPHAIPSRMTMAQLLETLFGKAAAVVGGISDGTSFMNDGNPTEYAGKVLEEHGFEKYGNELLYDGTTGKQIPSYVFIGNCYTMRLKHMTQDKWNARGAGRREKRTHQPTGGRGNEGGLRIGEMERDGIAAHGTEVFLRESFMKRSDETIFTICNGCGTVPITNPALKLSVCPLCDGPVRFAGEHADDLTLIPPNTKSLATFSKVEMPYATYLVNQEMNTYMNMGMRILTARDLDRLKRPDFESIFAEERKDDAETELQMLTLPDTSMPEFITAESTELTGDAKELGKIMGVAPTLATLEEEMSKRIAERAAAGLPPPLPTSTRVVRFGDTLEVPSDRPSALRFDAPEFVMPGQPTMVQQTTMMIPSGLEAQIQDPRNATVVGPPSLQTGMVTPFVNAPVPSIPGGIAPIGMAPAENAAVANAAVANAALANTQPISQQQVVTTTYAPPLEAKIIQGSLPGGPVNIAVDTSADAMRATGLPPLPLNARPLNTVPTNRPNAPSVPANVASVPASAKITVIKQG